MEKEILVLRICTTMIFAGEFGLILPFEILRNHRMLFLILFGAGVLILIIESIIF